MKAGTQMPVWSTAGTSQALGRGGQRRAPATLSFIASSEAATPFPERGKAVSVRLIERSHQDPRVSE